MAFTWRYDDTQGRPVEPGPIPGELPLDHPTQSDAESWLGEVWRDLRAAGVDSVTLVEDGTIIYGPMSLHEG